MPLRERISTMLRLSSGQLTPHSDDISSLPPTPLLTPGSHLNTPSLVGTLNTPADSLTSPGHSFSFLRAKSTTFNSSSSRQHSESQAKQTKDVANEATLLNQAQPLRLPAKISTIPKRMLRHSSNYMQQKQLQGSKSNQSNSAVEAQPSLPGAPPTPTTPPRVATTCSSPNSTKKHHFAWMGHKYAHSAGISPPSSHFASAQESKRPLTYISPVPTTVPKLSYFRPAESTPSVIESPHPGQPYDPCARPLAPPRDLNARPHTSEPRLDRDFAQQPRLRQALSRPDMAAMECWEDDPPHVRRRLQNRHWESLFGDFSWEKASARSTTPSLSSSVLSSASAASAAADLEGLSPWSRQPGCLDDRHLTPTTNNEDDERGRSRQRRSPRSGVSSLWSDSSRRPSDRRSEGLTDKFAKVRIKW